MGTLMMKQRPLTAKDAREDASDELLNKAYETGRRVFIRLGDLRAHDDIQRLFDQRRGDKIAAGFNPIRWVCPTVGHMPNGDEWVLDGQTRIYGVKEYFRNKTTQVIDLNQRVECIVVDCANEQEAADICLVLNDQKVFSIYDKYRLGVIARYETNLKVDRVLKSRGLAMAEKRGGKTGDGVVLAVAKCLELAEKDNDLFSLTFHVIHGTWQQSAGAYAGQILQGVFTILSKYSTMVSLNALVETLGKTWPEPETLLAQADKLSKLSGKRGGSMARHVTELVRKAYNERRKSGFLPEHL
jgi:hypothetical protein